MESLLERLVNDVRHSVRMLLGISVSEKWRLVNAISEIEKDWSQLLVKIVSVMSSFNEFTTALQMFEWIWVWIGLRLVKFEV